MRSCSIYLSAVEFFQKEQLQVCVKMITAVSFFVSPRVMLLVQDRVLQIGSGSAECCLRLVEFVSLQGFFLPTRYRFAN